MGHMDIWSALEKTDPNYTKTFKRGGGFSGTAINGTYIVRRLTETFGPCGKGWRFVIEDERIEDGHTLAKGDKARVHIVRGHLAYMMEGTWYETSPQFGQTMLVSQNKHGVFTDEEAPKKSITDCISKCAVLLGIGADIHLGLFDDNKYVNTRLAEEAAKKNGGAGNSKPKAETRTDPRAGGQHEVGAYILWDAFGMETEKFEKPGDFLTALANNVKDNSAWFAPNADQVAHIEGTMGHLVPDGQSGNVTYAKWCSKLRKLATPPQTALEAG